MLLVTCPYCGPRAESEFNCGGEADIARPVATETLSDREWGDYLFMRHNPRGLHREQWVHTHGCRRWFIAERDTHTYAFHAFEKFGASKPGEQRMSQSHRLPDGGHINRARPLTFHFNGKPYEGFQGDTLASALLANGVHFVARSWKYHRPRGILTAGVEEPNAIVQLETGAHTVPNARATEIELYQGLAAASVNAEPGIENDRMAINQKIARFMPAGFYYKTFMWPQKWWPKYERFIRAAAGLGVSPGQNDPDHYDKTYAHCDILVVGAGPAGLTAAWTASKSGARVILVDDQPELGGSLLSGAAIIDKVTARQWIERIAADLQNMPEVKILSRSTAFGYQDHNLVTINQRLTDHLPLADRHGARERLWKVRAKHVILATGAHERPIVFGNNDLPGVMLASAISSYIHRYGVLPGRRVVIFTNNDMAYQTAIDLKTRGAQVTVVDPRPAGRGTLPGAAIRAGVTVLNQAVVVEANGQRHVKSVQLHAYTRQTLGAALPSLTCDLLGVSGGWNPVLHLFAQSGGRARWHESKVCFVPDVSRQPETSVGAANGEFSLSDALSGGARSAHKVATALGFNAPTASFWPTTPVTAEATVSRQPATPVTEETMATFRPATPIDEEALLPIWLVGERKQIGRGPKQFVDYQNDVSAADIYLAAREGYHSIEHVKRYTAMGFGTDQGKLGNINGMAILAEALDQSIPATGTTTFRPNYTPVSFGVLAGAELDDLFDPVRKTCMHEWHVEHGALFEDVGNWKRPRYFPCDGEDLHAAVKRECLAVRNGVGLLDASTLGKIDIQGPDAATLLNWVYTNPWTKLEVGKCRYGLMLDENGMVFDDGVTVRLAEQRYLMHTTTGGAARVLSWLERWLQTEWPGLKVRLTSVTDQWATLALVGPHSRRVLQKVCQDIDISHAAFPFMSYRAGTVAEVAARVMRISFSGELAYEINVPANLGRMVWEALMAAGKEYGITPYGTETMHVLRAEKGYIIVGQDTDGSITPADLNMGGLVAKTKDCLGKRSLVRSDTESEDRKQLVGLLTDDPNVVLQEGGQVVAKSTSATSAMPDKTAPMLGHVTSSYYSPTLNRSIALALVKGGLGKMGESVAVTLESGGYTIAKIHGTVFHDPEGTRQHVE